MADNNLYLRSDVDKGETSPDKDLRLRSETSKTGGASLTLNLSESVDAYDTPSKVFAALRLEGFSAIESLQFYPLFLRQIKGSRLNTSEFDTDLRFLNDRKLELSYGSITSSATPTPASTHNVFSITALAANAVFAAPSGTPLDGWRLLIRIVSSGTYTLGWNAAYSAVGCVLPASISNTTIYVACIRNGSTGVWNVVDVTKI